MFYITKEAVREELVIVLEEIVGKTLAKRVDYPQDNPNKYSLVKHTYNTLLGFGYEKAKEDFFRVMFDDDFLEKKIDGIKKEEFVKIALLYHDIAKIFDNSGYHAETSAKELSKINNKKSLFSKLTKKQKNYVINLVNNHHILYNFALLCENPVYRENPNFELRLKEIYNKTKNIVPEIAFITLANHRGKAEQFVFELDKLVLATKMLMNDEPPEKVKYNVMLNRMHEIIEDVVMKYASFFQ